MLTHTLIRLFMPRMNDNLSLIKLLEHACKALNEVNTGVIWSTLYFNMVWRKHKLQPLQYNGIKIFPKIKLVNLGRYGQIKSMII